MHNDVEMSILETGAALGRNWVSVKCSVYEVHNVWVSLNSNYRNIYENMLFS